MEILDTINKVEKSHAFKGWRLRNPHCYLVHVLSMLDEANAGSYQIGYYDPDTDRITTFIIDTDDVQATPDAEVFKKDGDIPALDRKRVKVDISAALKSVRGIQEKRYSAHIPLKKIVILQNIDGNQVYNITYITRSFSVLNIRISSDDGRVVLENLSSIIDFKSSMPQDE